MTLWKRNDSLVITNVCFCYIIGPLVYSFKFTNIICSRSVILGSNSI